MIEQPQENKGSNFKAESFLMGDHQYLYEVQESGENSIVKIFNNEGKPKSTQRINLPPNGLVYPCENYLIALTPSQIYLYQIANISIKSSCANPGVKRIELVRYNKQLKLIFFLNQKNDLYYIMSDAPGLLQVKQILASHNYQIKFPAVKLQIGHNSIVNILSNRTLHCLKFNWNKKDVFESSEKIPNVVDVYYQQKWSVVIKESEEDENNYIVEITDENINDTPSKFSSNVPKFSPDNLPIIKSTPTNLMYLDCRNKSVILIQQKQQLYVREINLNFPLFRRNLVYEIKKKEFNKIHLILHFFEGTRENFRKVEVPIKLLEMDDEENTLIYIHNNIHLILTKQGVERHFSEKVKQYVELESGHNISDQKLTCMLLEKLFQKSPLTITKLASHFRKLSHNIFLPSFLQRYLEYVSIILYQIPFMRGLNGVPSEGQELFLKKVEQLDDQICSMQYQNTKAKLQSMITFTSMLLFAIKQDQVGLQRKKAEKKDMSEENIPDCSKYYRIVERCKVVYLLNQIYFKFAKDSINNFKCLRLAGSKIASEISDKSKVIDQEDSSDINLKIGVRACHQVFSENLPTKVSIKQAIKYLADCENFYHGAYFYLAQFKQLKEIPYIGDYETVDLIRFLIDSPVKMLSDRQQLRLILKNLAKMAGKALVINQPTFLKYLCSLSVNAGEYKSCLAILISGVGKQWTPKTHQFIIECLILCDRTALAYKTVQDLGRSDRHHKRELMQLFTSRCIREKKIKDLLDISKEQVDEEYIKEELNKAFGDDVKEIIKLMEKLTNSQS